jgi:hypothetical protein
MSENPEATEKITDFVNEVILFARNGHSRFSSVDELISQALIILTIEQLNIQNNALESIKHLLTDAQISDINNIIDQNVAMKSKLYSNVLPM